MRSSPTGHALVEAVQFEGDLHEDGNEDKLAPKIDAIKDCAILYVAAIGGSGAARVVAHNITGIVGRLPEQRHQPTLHHAPCHVHLSYAATSHRLSRRLSWLRTYYTLTSTSLVINMAGRTDYAVNAGDTVQEWIYGPPEAIASAANDVGWGRAVDSQYQSYTGICYERSEVTMADVVDGASNTYMIGEKYLSPDHYLNGLDGADNENLYVGFDNDQYRFDRPRLVSVPGPARLWRQRT